MLSRDVNVLTRLAEASWSRDKYSNQNRPKVIGKLDAKSNSFDDLLHLCYMP